MRETYAKKCDILLVEDDPGDVRLVVDIFKEGAVKHEVHVMSNGLEALNFLQRKENHSDAVRPDLILLDLNMPVMNGFDFLKEVKQDPILRTIPVCVLSTSSFDKDLEDAYQLFANSYIIKPLELNAYRDMIRSIESFWLQTATLTGK